MHNHSLKNKYVGAKTYDDGVCYSYYPVDLHSMGEETLHNIYLEKGAVPQIPLSAMLVKGFKNLMVAGRCISGDRLAHSAFRIKASCMAMGQAAGATAYLAAAKNAYLRDVQISDTIANNVNHPNDFLARAYAQTILSVL